MADLETERLGSGPLGIEEIASFTLPHNRASRRVMEKIGLVYDRDFFHAGLPHVLYRTAADYTQEPPTTRE